MKIRLFTKLFMCSTWIYLSTIYMMFRACRKKNMALMEGIRQMHLRLSNMAGEEMALYRARLITEQESTNEQR